jgi:PKHD-type hydroxylase
VNPFVANIAQTNLLTKEECEGIIAWKNDPNYGMQEGSIKDIDGYDKKYRVCNIYFDKRGPNNQPTILNKVIDTIMEYNQENYKFDCGGVLSGEWPTLIEYNVGGKYDWHIDVFHTEATPITACRKISFTVMLSEPEDFDGGRLEFQGGGVPPEMNQGDICLFPSYLPHRVTPVTRGQRNVVVGWIHGNSWK